MDNLSYYGEINCIKYDFFFNGQERKSERLSNGPYRLKVHDKNRSTRTLYPDNNSIIAEVT